MSHDEGAENRDSRFLVVAVSERVLADGSEASTTLYRGRRVLTLERLKSEALLNRLRKNEEEDLVLAVVDEIGVAGADKSWCDAMEGVHSVLRLMGLSKIYSAERQLPDNKHNCIGRCDDGQMQKSLGY